MTQNRRSSTIFHHRRWLFGILIVIGFSAVCLYWFITIQSALTPTLSSYDSAIKQTEELLAAVREHPYGPMPDSIPGYLRGGIGCWTFFQERLAQDANQYTITVLSEYDSRNSPEPNRDMVEIWLQVDFIDGKHAKIYYYQGGISGCHEAMDQ